MQPRPQPDQAARARFILQAEPLGDDAPLCRSEVVAPQALGSRRRIQQVQDQRISTLKATRLAPQPEVDSAARLALGPVPAQLAFTSTRHTQSAATVDSPSRH